MTGRVSLSVRLGHLLGLGPGLVDAHFSGTSTAAADRRMWRHLPGCPTCRERYEARAALDALDALDRGDSDGDATAAERLGRGLFAASSPIRTRTWALPTGLALAGAAAVVLLAPRMPATPSGRGPSRLAPEAPTFQARGPTALTPTKGQEASLVPSLLIFRVRPGEAPQRSGAVVRAGEALAFAYTNPTAATHLMVFAVDAAGRIFWFWPAWTDPSSDPEAVPITRATAPIELTEAVRQPLAPGRLRVQALFLDGPRRVREVEATLTRDGLADLGGRVFTEELEILP